MGKNVDQTISEIRERFGISDEAWAEAQDKNKDGFGPSERAEIIQKMEEELQLSYEKIQEMDMSDRIEALIRWNMAFVVYQMAVEAHDELQKFEKK